MRQHLQAGDCRAREFAEVVLSAGYGLRGFAGVIRDIHFEIVMEHGADLVALAFTHERFHLRQKAHGARFSEIEAADSEDHHRGESQQNDEFFHAGTVLRD